MTTAAHPFTDRTIRVNSWHELICLCGSFAEKTDVPGLRHCFNKSGWHFWRYDDEKQAFVFEREGWS